VARGTTLRPTSSEFTVGTNNNASGDNYVAYLFAHDAGGFGDSGNESVVSVGVLRDGSSITNCDNTWMGASVGLDQVKQRHWKLVSV
jgi:hypothetical protein